MRALTARVAGLEGASRAALAMAAGAALTLAQPPLSLWPALFLGWPALLVLLGLTRGPVAAAWLGFAAGFGFFLTGLYWVGEAFLVEAGKVWWYLPAMPVAVAALAAACALFWAGGFALARALWRPGWGGALALGLAMTAAEIARGWALTGFPWALQAYGWTETPLMQTASLVGAYTLSGLTVAAAATLAAGPLRRPWPGLAAAAAIALGWGWGAARLSAPAPGPEGPVIRLVQPSTRQVDKWAPENRSRIFATSLALTAAPPSGAAPALVVWPEVAVTFLFDESPEAIARAAAAAPEGAALAVGAVRRGAEGRLYNSLQFYDAGGDAHAVYDKRRLAPFGEYVPYAWVLGRIGFGTLGDGLSGFSPGDRAAPVALPGLPPLAPLICYEVIFPGLVREGAEGARWMLQVTNDAWFGTSAGPWQHLAQARWRAVEQGLPVARAAGAGVTAMIDARGRIVAEIGLERRGALDSPLPPPTPPTLYARLGDAPPVALWATAALLLLRLRAGRHTKE